MISQDLDTVYQQHQKQSNRESARPSLTLDAEDFTSQVCTYCSWFKKNKYKNLASTDFLLPPFPTGLAITLDFFLGGEKTRKMSDPTIIPKLNGPKLEQRGDHQSLPGDES